MFSHIMAAHHADGFTGGVLFWLVLVLVILAVAWFIRRV